MLQFACCWEQGFAPAKGRKLFLNLYLRQVGEAVKGSTSSEVDILIGILRKRIDQGGLDLRGTETEGYLRYILEQRKGANKEQAQSPSAPPRSRLDSGPGKQ